MRSRTAGIGALIETHSVWRRRCDCPPLSRPHNPRYVQVPARARLNALRAGRCAAFLIAMADTNNRRPAIRARVYPLSVLPPAIVVRCWPCERSTVLAVSRADLDTAALDAGRTWPTALESES